MSDIPQLSRSPSLSSQMQSQSRRVSPRYPIVESHHVFRSVDFVVVLHLHQVCANIPRTSIHLKINHFDFVWKILACSSSPLRILASKKDLKISQICKKCFAAEVKNCYDSTDWGWSCKYCFNYEKNPQKISSPFVHESRNPWNVKVELRFPVRRQMSEIEGEIFLMISFSFCDDQRYAMCFECSSFYKFHFLFTHLIVWNELINLILKIYKAMKRIYEVASRTRVYHHKIFVYLLATHLKRFNENREAQTKNFEIFQFFIFSSDLLVFVSTWRKLCGLAMWRNSRPADGKKLSKSIQNFSNVLMSIEEVNENWKKNYLI